MTCNSNPELSRSNAGATSHKGLELSLVQQVTSAFSINSNLTWVPELEFKTGTNAGKRLPYAPKLVVNLGLSYELERLALMLNMHHRVEQFGDPTNRIDIPSNAAGGIGGGLLPSYTAVDLLSQYQLSDNFTVFGTFKNITDKRYIAGLREGIYVGSERAFEMGGRYRF